MRPAEPRDATAIAAIYNQGIEERQATFQTRPHSAGDFAKRIAGELPFLVAEEDGGKIFTSNGPSIELITSLGYREVGVHRRHGRLDSEWKDVLVVELLLGEGASEPPGVETGG